MKLKEDYITYETDGEQIMVCASGAFSGMARSNKTASFIIECLREDTTEEKIVEKMLEKYDAPKEIISADVAKIIVKLREIGAIED